MKRPTAREQDVARLGGRLLRPEAHTGRGQRALGREAVPRRPARHVVHLRPERAPGVRAYVRRAKGVGGAVAVPRARQQRSRRVGLGAGVVEPGRAQERGAHQHGAIGITRREQRAVIAELDAEALAVRRGAGGERGALKQIKRLPSAWATTRPHPAVAASASNPAEAGGMGTRDSTGQHGSQPRKGHAHPIVESGAMRAADMVQRGEAAWLDAKTAHLGQCDCCF